MSLICWCHCLALICKGCAGSKEPEFKPARTAPKEIDNPHINFTRRRKNSIHQLNLDEKQAVTQIFDDYRRQTRVSQGQPGDDGGAFDGAEYESQNGHKLMKKEGLRKVLPDVDDQFFEFLWRLFDTSGSGTVDADEFVMVMALLSSGIADSAEAQLANAQAAAVAIV